VAGLVNVQPPLSRPLVNDFMSDEDFDRMLRAWFGNIARVLVPGRSFYLIAAEQTGLRCFLMTVSGRLRAAAKRERRRDQECGVRSAERGVNNKAAGILHSAFCNSPFQCGGPLAIAALTRPVGG